MIKTKQPKVVLFNHTPDPEKSIALAVSAWHAKDDDLIEDIDNFPPELADKFSKAGLRVFHKTAIEYVNLIFVIKNVSRAFQQQLTRTRHASFSIQSMRVLEKTNFAEKGNYTMPLYMSDLQKTRYHMSMVSIQRNYEKLIGKGVSIEDARGILPLNIHSDITMSINLNALYHMLTQRLCVLTQWEFRQVAMQMKQEIHNKLGEKFSSLIDAPCVKAHKCVMRTDYCGTKVWDLDNDEREAFYKEYTPDDNPTIYGYTK